ncbi:hypothetical protein HYPSUDRAFT_707296 [Hypholoma sublateritium FD-334 SS-4]|uniref:Secreted protein n=1 Tax=Hypholoma sublateritium (strain FD-334 SS-4) TaxID=945553 RepID=A0A0D2PJ33_HYPSF|nr:hypothetical protein HYPSUDRAFT_707296 [Hypholoma sublateritium FD-334 SS-4]
MKCLFIPFSIQFSSALLIDADLGIGSETYFAFKCCSASTDKVQKRASVTQPHYLSSAHQSGSLYVTPTFLFSVTGNPSLNPSSPFRDGYREFHRLAYVCGSAIRHFKDAHYSSFRLVIVCATLDTG